ncbi:MAG: HDOD domain-containing protein [Verrucomicrobiae bacterium]
MIESISLKSVCDKAASLPCAPVLVPKILALLDKPEASSADLSSLISRDPGTSAAVLRLANSAYFGRVKCGSLDEAFLRLGTREISRLVIGGIVGRWAAAPVEGYGWEPGDLCAHSFTVAIASDLIARERGDPVLIKSAYTAGLLHDIGKLGMAYACGQHFDLVRKRQEESDLSWRELEREVFGFDHTEVGGALLRRWNFPLPLVQVVEFYPRPKVVTGPDRALVLLVHAAKNLAINLGVGVGEDGFLNELDAPLLLEEGYTAEFFSALVPVIFTEMEKIIGPDGKMTFLSEPK